MWQYLKDCSECDKWNYSSVSIWSFQLFKCLFLSCGFFGLWFFVCLFFQESYPVGILVQDYKKYFLIYS